MKIGVDVDEVLAQTIDAFLAYYNDTYETSVTRDQVTDYFFRSVFTWSPEENLFHFNNFYLSEFFRTVMPVVGSVVAMQSLRSCHEVSIITSRPAHIAKETGLWLAENFQIKSDEVHFASLGTTRKKADICQELGINLLIDDSLEFAEECAAAGIEVLLMDAPWNRRELRPGIQRVHSWDEVTRMLVPQQAV